MPHRLPIPPSPGMVRGIAFVLFAAVLLELLGNIALHQWERRDYVAGGELRAISAQLIATDQALVETDRAHRGKRAAEFNLRGLEFNWVPRTVVTDVSATVPELAETRQRLTELAPMLEKRSLLLSILPSREPGRRDLFGAMMMTDGSFITFRVSPYLAAPLNPWLVTIAHLVLVGLVMTIALLMIRSLVRPLKDLAEAADATRLGQAAPVTIDGPNEVRRVAAAFSAMQGRLLQTMEDHTQALVAVSHDLRTPIQRLQLRAGLLEDKEVREAIGADLDEMERFIAATLAFVREDKEEAWRLADIATLVTTAVDNAVDAGADVDYAGVDTLTAATRTTALKRVLGNLIDNAVRYGTNVTVGLEAAPPGHFTITIDDDGPGIPEAKRAEALLPFRRLDQRAARSASGAGLGLAICVKAVAGMDGTLVLEESPMGGLRALIVLPVREVAGPPQRGAKG